MNTTIIVKKTAKKTAKKTEKKEYLFNQDVWRIIMSYVGTPQQFIDRRMKVMIQARENRRMLYKDNGYVPFKNEIDTIPAPILMTLDEYNFEGFKNQKDLYTDIYDYVFNSDNERDELKFIIYRLYGNNNPVDMSYKIKGDNILKGKRILKVLVKKELVNGLHYTQIYHSLILFQMILARDYKGDNPLMGTQYLVVVSNTKK